MQYSVAFVNLHSQQLALVEIRRDRSLNELENQQLQEQLSKVPELAGCAVVLAVPPDGQFEAGFRTSPDTALALKKIGWLRLGFQPTELTLPH